MANSKILRVEDEAITAQDIAFSLTGLGYEVVGIASNSSDAMRLCEQFHPELALMDIVIKGHLNGTATALELRRRYNIPVVYLSAYSDTLTLNNAQQSEPLGYLTKPFNENDLKTTVGMALIKAKADIERDALLKRLQEALGNVKTLSGFIPICAKCKKIRDDQGFWQAVESYISRHSEAEFSHSLCPDCLVTLYPDLYPPQNDPA